MVRAPFQSTLSRKRCGGRCRFFSNYRPLPGSSVLIFGTLLLMATATMSFVYPLTSRPLRALVKSKWTSSSNPFSTQPIVSSWIRASTWRSEVKAKAPNPSQQRRISRLQRHEYNLKIRGLVTQDSSASISTTTYDSTSSTEPTTTTTTTTTTTPPLYAIKATICSEIRKELLLNGREKRGRVFLPADSLACRDFHELQTAIHNFFRFLRKGTFVLTASLPPPPAPALETTEVEAHMEGTAGDKGASWPIQTNEDVVQTFQKANQFFLEHAAQFKRPTILLHIERDPNAPPVPPRPVYLEGMPDPSTSESITMLSFYAFPPNGIENSFEFAGTLKKLWKPFGALGRVYVATEGVNAQMSVPTNVLTNFMACCKSIPELGSYMENGINVDPVPIPKDEFPTAGLPINGQPAPPFRNLHVRVRPQVVADGLDKSLNWQSAGYDMPPLEWHEQLKRAKEMREQNSNSNNKDTSLPLIFDCRNTYETSVGRFDGAVPLKTANFKETWDVLKEQLANTPKDAPIMTYCTGGIRCVKVGAYLTQELGFTNVSRLAGGIIAYDRTLNDVAPTEESMFKGTNFVFDGRLGRAITEDAMGICMTCGSETSLVSNCLNDWCHKRIVQCESCRTSFHGTCSQECKQRVLNGAMLARRRNVNGATTATDALADDASNQKPSGAYYNNIDDYSMGHSSPIPPFLDQIEENTRTHFPTGAHMVSGAAQGRLLTDFASMTREGRILEIGTFTGYATACLLEGAAEAGRAMGQSGGSRRSGPYVMTLERKPESFALAVAHLKTMAEHDNVGDVAAQAAQQFCGLLPDDDESSDSDSSDNSENDDDVYQYVPKVEDEIVSLSYQGVAGCDLIKVNDALATVEAIALGMSDIQPAPFDMVFLDADKVRLLEYAEACIANDNLLKKGGIIVVDNTLWKGLVVEASRGSYSTMSMEEEVGAPDAELRRNRRARKLATLMHRFNSEIVKDDRVEVRLLTMRDGLTIIRKKT